MSDTADADSGLAADDDNEDEYLSHSTSPTTNHSRMQQAASKYVQLLFIPCNFFAIIIAILMMSFVSMGFPYKHHIEELFSLVFVGETCITTFSSIFVTFCH